MKLTTWFPVLAAGMLLAGAVVATPLGPHYKPKWSQLPDMDQGTDMLSMHRSFGPVVADDFVSDGRTIGGLHWWGSYFQTTGQGLERNVSFEISFHENCLANDGGCGNGGPYPFATPSDGNYFSAIVTAEEDFYGTTAGGEDVYEYWLDLTGIPGPGFWGGTWNEVAGETYWVDIAWNSGQFGTAIADDVWGWHMTSDPNLASAVQTAPGGSSNPHIGPWNQLAGTHMAFEVMTVPEPASLALLALGAAGVRYQRRKQTKAL